MEESAYFYGIILIKASIIKKIVMKSILLFIVFIVSFKGHSQSVSVFGLITNSEGNFLYSAKIEYETAPQKFVLSNKSGGFEFKTDDLENRILRIMHVQHKMEVYKITQKDIKRIKNNRLELNFVLNDSVLNIIIVGNKKPIEFFKSEEFSVADFEIDKMERVVLLTYPKKLQKGSDIKLLDNARKVIDTYHFSGRAVELLIDYRKNIHLIAKQNMYLVVIEKDKIHLLKEDQNHYFKYVSPILDTLNDNFYYSNYSDIYPAFTYFQFSKIDSVYTSILGIIDKPMMEQYRAEFKFSDVRTRLWAANKQEETGIDKEIWVGAAIFSHSIYYEPLYAPLFVNNDTILVFDHYKNLMFKYSNDLSYSDSLPISYHWGARKSGWEQPLIQDKEQGNIYVLFERDGYSYLSLVDLQTGKIKYSRRLFYKYIEKLKIVDNQIFYIYRPFESIQKKYIYKETINL